MQTDIKRIILFLLLLTTLKDTATGVPCGYPGSSSHGRPSRVQESYGEGQAVNYSCDPGYFLLGPSVRKCTRNGTWTPSRVPLCDSRLGGLSESADAESSQPLSQYPAKWAVDGDPDTCAYAGRATPRWWRLDLGKSHRILSVAITVADPQAEQNLAVYILGLSGNSAIYQRCASFTGKFASSSVVLPCSGAAGGGGTGSDGGGLVGRFLHVEDGRKELVYFGLCEIDIIVRRDRYECGPPERPVNSYTVRLKLDQVEYRCVAGHRLAGNRRRQCLTNGQWSGEQPLCIEVRCPPPSPVDHGRVRFWPGGSQPQQAMLGTVAMYNCDPGFSLQGGTNNSPNGTRMCGEDGQWTPLETPVCRPVDCGQPELAESLPRDTILKLLNGSETGYGSAARFRCPSGYEPSTGHEDIIRCTGDGTWTRPRIKCLSTQHAPGQAVEAAREEPAESITLALVLGLVGTVLLLTMVLAILCLILRRRRRNKSSVGGGSVAGGASSSSRGGSGSLQGLCHRRSTHGSSDDPLYSAPIQPARPVISVIYDYPRRAPVAVPYPFTPIPPAVNRSGSSSSRENIYEEIALNGGGKKIKHRVHRHPEHSKSSLPPHLDPQIMALYAQVDFNKKRQSREQNGQESPDHGPLQQNGGGPQKESGSPEGGGRELPPLPPPPDNVTVQNDIYDSEVMVENELYS